MPSLRLLPAFLALSASALAAVPDTPANVSPAAGWGEVYPLLTGSAYSDADGDAQTGARFEVRTAAGVYGDAQSVALSSPVLGPVTSWQLGTLTQGESYYWRVSYRDAEGWSAPSAETAYSYDNAPPTAPTYLQLDGGVEDGQFTAEFGPSYDPDSQVRRFNLVAVQGDAGITFTHSNPADAGFAYPVTLGPDLYVLKVRGEDWADNHSPYTQGPEFTVVADAGVPLVSGLTATPAMTNGTVTLRYTAPAGSGYRYVVARSADGTNYRHLKVTSSSTSTTDTPSTSGTYRYKVSTAAGAWVGPWTGATADVLVDRAAPSRPAGLTVTPATSTGPVFELAWTASSDTGGAGLERYDVQRAPQGTTTWTTVVSTDAGTAATDLPADGRWAYRVSAVDAVSNRSSWSLAVSALRDTVPPTSPGAPQPLVALTRDPVQLAWTAASDATTSVVSYVLERDDGLGAGFVALPGAPAVPSATDPAADGVYLYRAIAVDEVGHRSEPSPASVQVVVDASAPNTPAAPLAGPSPSAGPITVSWAAVSDVGPAGLEAYRLERSPDGSSWSILATTTALTFEDVPADGSWRYRVVAVDRAGNEAASLASPVVQVEATPSRLAFLTPPRTSDVGVCHPATVESRNSFAQPARPAADTPVAVTAPAGVALFSNAACSAALGAFAIAAGATEATFHWQATSAGTFTIAVSAGGWTGAEQVHQVSRGQGSPCTSDTECATGLCTDGYCCDLRCAGGCEACDLAGLEGVCTARPRFQDPEAACGTGACAGACDGARACEYPGQSTSCGTCQACDGAGACGAVANGTSCADGSYCNGAEVCQAGACQPGNVVSCPPSSTSPMVCDEASQGCVAPPTSPPLITRDAHGFGEVGVPYAYNAEGRVHALGTRPMTFAACGGPPELRVEARTGAVRFTPAAAGNVALCVQATNELGGPDRYDFTVQVSQTSNGAPTARIGGTLSGPAPFAPVLDGSTSASFDGAPLHAWRWREGTFAPRRHGANLTADYLLPGGHRAELEVLDRGGRSGRAFAGIAALGPNGERPAAARITASAVRGDGSLQVQLGCECTPGDAPLRAVTWRTSTGERLEGNPVTVTFGPGRHHALLEVVDANGLSSFDKVELVVTQAGAEPPECEVVAEPPALIAGSTSVRHAIELAPGANEVASVELTAGTVTEAVVERVVQYPGDGRVETSARVVDTAGLACGDVGLVRVAAAGGVVAPEILTRGLGTAVCGLAYAYSTTSNAPGVSGTGPFGYRLEGTVPEGMSLDAATGELTWTPTSQQVGAHDVVVRVDGAGGSAIEALHLEVTCPDAETFGVGCGCSTGGGAASAFGVLLALRLLRRRRAGR